MNFPNQLTSEQMQAESFIARSLQKISQSVDKESKAVTKAVESEFRQATKDADMKGKEWKKDHAKYSEDMITGVRDALVANLDRQEKVLTQQDKLDIQMEAAHAAAKKA